MFVFIYFFHCYALIKICLFTICAYGFSKTMRKICNYICDYKSHHTISLILSTNRNKKLSRENNSVRQKGLGKYSMCSFNSEQGKYLRNITKIVILTLNLYQIFKQFPNLLQLNILVTSKFVIAFNLY